MDDKQEPQTSEPIPAASILDLTAGAAVSDSGRRGEWQGYDPTLLNALFED
jgi:hypothetical protein